MKRSDALKIGELANQCGVSPDTVRFYEREGLLPRPRRTPARHRIYDQNSVLRLQFIRRAQQMGLSLDDIRLISRVRTEGRSDPCPAVSDQLRERLRAVEGEIERLRARRRRLARSLGLCLQSQSGNCEFLARLTNSSGGRRERARS